MQIKRDIPVRNPNAPRHPMLLKVIACGIYTGFFLSLALTVGVLWVAIQPSNTITIQRVQPDANAAEDAAGYAEEAAPEIQSGNKPDISRYDNPGYECQNAPDCVNAGHYFMVKSQNQKAAAQLERGCLMKDPRSCRMRGELEYYHLIPNTSSLKADHYLRQSCFSGENASGCVLFAENLRKNFNPSSQRDMEIRQALDIACSRGERQACDILAEKPASAPGKKTEKTEKTEVITEARAQELTEACQNGDNQACFSVAKHYETLQDLMPRERTEKTREIYEILCQRREPQGCQSLRKIKRAEGI